MQCTGTLNRLIGSSQSRKHTRPTLPVLLLALLFGSAISNTLYADYLAPMWFQGYAYSGWSLLCSGAAPAEDPRVAAQNCASVYNNSVDPKHNLTVAAQTDQGDFWVKFACGGHFNNWNSWTRKYEQTPCEYERFWTASGFCPKDEDDNAGTLHDIENQTCIYPSSSESCTLNITAPPDGAMVFTDTPRSALAGRGHGVMPI